MADDDWKGEARLRGIKAPKSQGRGHNFKKSGLARRAVGETDKAPPAIYRENMKSEERDDK